MPKSEVAREYIRDIPAESGVGQMSLGLFSSCNADTPEQVPACPRETAHARAISDYSTSAAPAQA